MKKISPPLAGLLQTFGVIIYCILISLFFQYAGNYFPKSSELLISTFMLFLLVVSAGITGSMVFGYPAYLALKKDFKAAIYVLLYTLLYSVIITSILVAILPFFQ